MRSGSEAKTTRSARFRRRAERQGGHQTSFFLLVKDLDPDETEAGTPLPVGQMQSWVYGAQPFGRLKELQVSAEVRGSANRPSPQSPKGILGSPPPRVSKVQTADHS